MIVAPEKYGSLQARTEIRRECLSAVFTQNRRVRDREELGGRETPSPACPRLTWTLQTNERSQRHGLFGKTLASALRCCLEKPRVSKTSWADRETESGPRGSRPFTTSYIWSTAAHTAKLHRSVGLQQSKTHTLGQLVDGT